MAALGDRPGDDVARRELVGEAVAVVVDEQRALAAQRLREQEAVVERARSGGTARTRGRRAPRRRGRRARARRRARRAGSSCAPRAPRSRPSRAASPRAASARRSVTTPAQRPSASQSRPTPLALGDRDPRVRAGPRGQRLRDRLPGLGAARVDDAPVRVAALAAEVVVELDAELDEVGDPRGRLLGQRANGALAAEAAAGAQRVLGVQARRVALAERRRDAALRVVAVRREDGPFASRSTSASAAALSAA